MAERNCFDMTKLIFRNDVCYRGAVVKELFARADKAGSTPGNVIFSFFVPFFFFCLVSLFFNTFFSLFLLLTLLVMQLDQYIF